MAVHLYHICIHISYFSENEITRETLKLLDEATIKELIPRIGTRLAFSKKLQSALNNEDVQEKSVSYTCFKCYKSIKGIGQLFKHHRYIHHLTSNSATNMICPICKASFGLYKTYKRHVLANHHAEIAAADGAEVEAATADDDYDVEDFANDENNGGDEYESDDPNHLDDMCNKVTYDLAAFISNLKKRGIPTSSIQAMIGNVKELMSGAMDHMHKKISTLRDSFNAESLNDEAFEEALQACNLIMKPFEDLRSEYKQIKYLVRNGSLILPVEIDFEGYCYKGKLNKSGRMQQVKCPEGFQYIPLKELIQAYLQQPGMMTAILSYQKEGSENVLESYRDGKFYKEVFAEGNKQIVPIILYCDEFETANPLGSRRGQHKMYAFYMQILSIPKKLKSSLQNILLVALAKSKLVSKYGIDAIIKVLVEDFEKMYTDGIHISRPGEFEGLVTPKLFQICGDNLGIHHLLGYVLGFTANFPCRECKAPKQVCQEQEEEEEGLLRNRENFEQDLELENLSATGISRNSILNELSYYHVIQNFAYDTMHDFLEGVIPREVKLVMKSLIDAGYFTLEVLNSRISAFSFGFVDKQNQPTPITPQSLDKPKGSSGQTAAQMQCLFLYLPLLIGDKLDRDEGSEEWELILILLDIYKLVTAPCISLEATFFLKARIKEHHSLFKEVFPDTPLTPKQHHLIHYPRAIRMLGPLSAYSSIRFEGKHKPLKAYAKNASNYKKVELTVAKQHQIGQSHDFLVKQDVRIKGIEILHQDLVRVSSLEDEEDVCAVLHCTPDADILVAGAVEVNGYTFRPCSVVLTNWNEELPEFGEVRHIVLLDSIIKLLIKPWKTLHFDQHFHSYAVSEHFHEALVVKAVDELGDYRPVHAMRCYQERDTNQYIVLRYQLA